MSRVSRATPTSKGTRRVSAPLTGFRDNREYKMSAGNPEGFPWGANTPSRPQRFAVAVVIAIAATILVATQFRLNPGQHSDFGPVWFGARAFVAGSDPYQLIGPGREFNWWNLTYPATTLVAMIPFAVFSNEALATILFVCLSTVTLVWGSTGDGWHRLPAFASLAFVIAAAAGQWSILLASSFFLPVLSIFWIAKPTLGIAIAAATPAARSLIIGLVAAVCLLGVSLLVLPHWPQDWISNVSASSHFMAPIARGAGFAIAANLLRWRRPEAWLVFILACAPQSPGVYDLLLLLVIVPATYREACVLSLASTAGGLLLNLVPPVHPAEWESARGMLIVVTSYLPATVIILRRPNEGELPAWLRLFVSSPP